MRSAAWLGVSPWLLAGAAIAAPHCDPDDGSVHLPEGFCALVVADHLGHGRHVAVAANGDVYLRLRAQSKGGTIMDGFEGPEPIHHPAAARLRPVGLAEGPDGSFYVSDSEVGRIWRVLRRR